MINIENLKNKIIKKLRSLRPNKIILFGNYAYSTSNENSDIDLFLLKDDLLVDETRLHKIKAHKSLKDLIKKYKISFDILSAPTKYIQKRDDYFYKVDILKNGKVIYK